MSTRITRLHRVALMVTVLFLSCEMFALNDTPTALQTVSRFSDDDADTEETSRDVARGTENLAIKKHWSDHLRLAANKVGSTVSRAATTVSNAVREAYRNVRTRFSPEQESPIVLMVPKVHDPSDDNTHPAIKMLKNAANKAGAKLRAAATKVHDFATSFRQAPQARFAEHDTVYGRAKEAAADDIDRVGFSNSTPKDIPQHMVDQAFSTQSITAFLQLPERQQQHVVLDLAVTQKTNDLATLFEKITQALPADQASQTISSLWKSLEGFHISLLTNESATPENLKKILDILLKNANDSQRAYLQRLLRIVLWALKLAESENTPQNPNIKIIQSYLPQPSSPPVAVASR